MPPSLSFYKEELEGETHNYVHTRASLERIPPVDVLRKLIEETLDTANRLDRMTECDPELRALWEEFKQVCAPRTYHLPLRVMHWGHSVVIGKTLTGCCL